MVGIYKITNLINQKVYIGQSRNIQERWRNHKITTFNPKDKGYQYPLYQEIRQYGIDNFLFEVLEECSIEELNNKEIKWIKYYDSFNNGYNLTAGGQGLPHPIKLNQSQVNEIIDLLRTTVLSQSEIADKFQVDQSVISMINTGRLWYLENESYPIREQSILSMKKEHKYCIDCGKEIDKKATRCTQCYAKFSRRVIRPNRVELKQMIRSMPFTKIGEKYGVSDKAISKWCKAENLPYRKTDIKNYSDEEWEQI